VRLLHLSRPLSGGLAAPEQGEELSQAAVMQHVALLRTHPELESVFADLDSFAEQLLALAAAAPDALGRVRPSLRAVVRGQWARATAALLASGCLSYGYDGFGGGFGGGEVTERHEKLLAQVVESYLMERVHPAVYPWLAWCHEATDAALSRALLRMRNSLPSSILLPSRQADVGVRSEFQCAQPEAIAAVAALGGAPAPMDKLLILKRAVAATHSRLQRHLETHHRDALEGDELQLATDDLVRLLVHAVVEAHPFSASLLTDLRYIKAFHFVSSSMSAVGFVLGHLVVTLEWIIAKEGLALVEEDDEYYGEYGGYCRGYGSGGYGGGGSGSGYAGDGSPQGQPGPGGGTRGSGSGGGGGGGGDAGSSAAATTGIGEQDGWDADVVSGWGLRVVRRTSGPGGAGGGGGGGGGSSWPAHQQLMGAGALRSIEELPPAATDVACVANVQSVLEEFGCGLPEDFSDPLGQLP
ncbi:unnamed protein product, partial [Phaeothamnion confervicola]